MSGIFRIEGAPLAIAFLPTLGPLGQSDCVFSPAVVLR